MTETHALPQGFAVGSWGRKFNPEFGPRLGDVVVNEHWAQSRFANSDLDPSSRNGASRRSFSSAWWPTPTLRVRRFYTILSTERLLARLPGKYEWEMRSEI
jgi:hypothetical protein